MIGHPKRLSDPPRHASFSFLLEFFQEIFVSLHFARQHTQLLLIPQPLRIHVVTPHVLIQALPTCRLVAITLGLSLTAGLAGPDRAMALRMSTDAGGPRDCHLGEGR